MLRPDPAAFLVPTGRRAAVTGCLLLESLEGAAFLPFLLDASPTRLFTRSPADPVPCSCRRDFKEGREAVLPPAAPAERPRPEPVPQRPGVPAAAGRAAEEGVDACPVPEQEAALQTPGPEHCKRRPPGPLPVGRRAPPSPRCCRRGPSVATCQDTARGPVSCGRPPCPQSSWGFFQQFHLLKGKKTPTKNSLSLQPGGCPQREPTKPSSPPEATRPDGSAAWAVLTSKS